MSVIQSVQGGEQHHAFAMWYQFQLQGLEQWQVQQDFPEDLKHMIKDSTHSYIAYTAEVPEGTIFTGIEKDGELDDEGKIVNIDQNYFTIYIACDHERSKDSGSSAGRVTGNFDVITRSATAGATARLKKWWAERPEGVSEFDWAHHCAMYIHKPGVRDLPPLIVEVSSARALKKKSLKTQLEIARAKYQVIADDLRAAQQDINAIETELFAIKQPF